MAKRTVSRKKPVEPLAEGLDEGSTTESEPLKRPKSAKKSVEATSQGTAPAPPKKKAVKSTREKKDAPAKKAASRKRADTPSAKEVRLKAFWAVYSPNFQKVKLFEYTDREGAELYAAELTETRKCVHYVRLEKVVIES